MKKKRDKDRERQETEKKQEINTVTPFFVEQAGC